MPQTARGRKTSSSRSRRAGAAGRSRAGTAKKPKKKTAARARPKKKASSASRRTTSRPRRKTAATAATRKKSASRSAAARKKASSRKKATSRKTAASRSRSVARKKPAARKKPPRAAARKKAVRKPAPRAESGAASRNGRTRGGAQVKDALLARRAETLDLLERSSDYGKQRLREDAEDLVDQATDSQARDVVYALSSAEGDMIKQIDGALERIDAGDYGKCDNCGEPIQKRRLEAVPWARLCVACQELQEQGILQTD